MNQEGEPVPIFHRERGWNRNKMNQEAEPVPICHRVRVESEQNESGSIACPNFSSGTLGTRTKMNQETVLS